MKDKTLIGRENIFLTFVNDYITAYRRLYVDAIVRKSKTNETDLDITDEIFSVALRKACLEIFKSIRKMPDYRTWSDKFFNRIDPMMLPSPLSQRKEFEERMLVLSQDFFEACQQAEEQRNNSILVPVADNHSFVFDSLSHIHAFMIGGTGSGKSTLIHMLLDEAVKLYSPSELQFYMMDFKGGVELNRYALYPHVRALLVGEGDSGIALEILRDIKKLQDERNEMFREVGCRDLQEYNAKHPDGQLPFVVLLVDECQKLFDFASSVQQEINGIISGMSREGRSQGVHFVFATQTLSSTAIPSDVQKLITDWYLLNCDTSDAERAVEGSWKLVKEMPKYTVLHYNKSGKEFENFALHRMKNEDMDATLKQVTKQYGEKDYGFTTFYFDGRQNYSIADTLARKKYRRYPEITLGRSFAVRGKTPSILLKYDMGQNLLILGNDTRHQGLRMLINAIVSLMHYSKATGVNAHFIFFLNHDLEEDSKMEDYIFDLKSHGIELADNRCRRADALRRLYEQVGRRERSDVLTFAFVSSQDTYVEMRQGIEIEVEQTEAVIPNKPVGGERLVAEANKFFGGNMAFTKSGTHQTSTLQTTKKISIKEAWSKILKEGPEYGVFTVWQLQELNRLMFNDHSYLVKEVSQLFQHVAFLKAKDNRVAAMFQIDQYVKLDQLSDSPHCLRSIVLNMTTNAMHTIVPFALPMMQEIDKTLKQ